MLLLNLDGIYSQNDMDSYWKKEILASIEMIEINLKKLELKLPAEGFMEIDALKFDVDMVKQMVEEIS